MGQVLGFSHCKEFGSVSSTPDSSPPCTDGGNEESDFPELQTAREWSDDEYGGEDDEGGTSSPSVWGTPRQNSFELTFSYFTIPESEGGGASRRDSAGGGRRRGGARAGRVSLNRVDTDESLVPAESPELEWEQHAFLSGEEEEEREDAEEKEEGGEREVPQQPSQQSSQQLPSQELTTQPLSQPSLELTTQPLSQPSLELKTQPLSHSCDPEPLSSGRGSPSREEEEPSGSEHCNQKDSFTADPLVATETTTVPLTSVHQPGSEITKATSSASTSSIGQNTQEELDSEQHLSASDLSECGGWFLVISVTDLIYWRDMEQTGMVFTGLVVGLLSLFQLSIISVISTLSLVAMCFTIAVRLYYRILHALQWNDGKHPFQSYLDLDITLSAEQAGTYMERFIVMTTSAIAELKRLLFVSSLMDSLKFLILMYLLTFLGDLFNGLTLLIIAVICLFSLPLFYKQHQAQVDGFLAKVKGSVDNVKDILHRLFHGGGRAHDSDPAPGGAKPKTK
ncbi:reticulon-2a [Anguilla rostrata]|uniref:reticulon-2a n=1 Tax=Anguilla rostrata TaxID=7938 RepID=UPI0030D2FD89